MARDGEPQPDSLMTTGEAARLHDLSPDMVRVLERKGRMPAQRTTNGLRLLRRGDVKALAAERARAAANRASKTPPEDGAVGDERRRGEDR